MKTTTYKIYKATFPDGKCYIGLTKNTVKERAKGHSYRLKIPKYHQIPLYAAMLMHGFESIKWEQLSEHEILIDAENEERKQIALHKDSCLNVLSGGLGTDNTNPELRRRVSEGLKGLVVKEETKDKLREYSKQQFSTEEKRAAHAQRMREFYETPEGKASIIKAKESRLNSGKYRLRNDKGHFI